VPWGPLARAFLTGRFDEHDCRIGVAPTSLRQRVAGLPACRLAGVLFRATQAKSDGRHFQGPEASAVVLRAAVHEHQVRVQGGPGHAGGSLLGDWAIWLFYILDCNVSIAAWVGMIALLGLDAETGVFMLLFLDLSYDEYAKSGRLKTLADLDEAIVHGAVKRARPKMMTVAAAFMCLLPIMWSTSAGADVMKRIAAPMIGGLATSFVLELLVYPAVFKLWKKRMAFRTLMSPAAAQDVAEV